MHSSENGDDENKKNNHEFEVLGIDHIAIVPRNAGESERFFVEMLGLGLNGREEVRHEKVEVTMLRTSSIGDLAEQTRQGNQEQEVGPNNAGAKSGEAKIELLTGTEEDSVVSRFLRQRGGGVHHIALRVSDVEQAWKYLSSQGVPVIGEGVRRGAHGTKVLFIHPRATGGVLIELVE